MSNAMTIGSYEGWEHRAIVAAKDAEIDRLTAELEVSNAAHAATGRLLAATGRERDEWREQAMRDSALAVCNEALKAERDMLRKVLRMIEEGDVPRPIGKVYRDDGAPSKHDQCMHGLWMYEDCGNCISEFAAVALATPAVSDAQQGGGQ